MNEVNGFELFVRYEQRKNVYYQPQHWLIGDTDFQFITALDLKTARNYSLTILKQPAWLKSKIGSFNERAVVAENTMPR
ncbi:hypothetical protein [uncultured Tolumonas sp.]|uniref:hypothetical protein n=1 Tax=uncultured Tolumonas sp. TaxID=263765 RepID=UPI0029309F7C|nr:hypothetical protein [uncultured Tolumonas sp.]